ncbi:MAG: hypothetical protein KDM81_13055, partial [Verrucomicrobiae bacterium]|nr:hypothetical protein [Verrucomicrobiae bacterium]
MARETTRRGIAPRENGTQPRVRTGLPPKQGLYDPWFEKDACGVGFVVHVKGHPSHRIVQQGLEILRNLTHRGACGCEPNTGDGAGLLIQIPHEFFRQEAGKAGFDLPAAGQYAVGMAYLPKDPAEQRACEDAFAAIAADEGQPVIGWRTVPTDNSMIGETALASEPAVRQVFLRRAPDVADD